MIILAIDVGNTNIHFGLFKGSKLMSQWRMTSNVQVTPDELGLKIYQFLESSHLPPGEIEGVAVACVVPPLISIIRSAVDRYLEKKAFFIDPMTNVRMPILYEHPEEVGADRLANAVAGVSLAGKPLIVVDFGTATTFDVISSRGEYMGGVIAPGIELSIGALTAKAARLPRLDLVEPARVIGRTTNESMQAGIVYGYAGLIDRVIELIMKELASRPEVISTGGLAGMIVPHTNQVHRVEANLTLEGIRLIYGQNKV